MKLPAINYTRAVQPLATESPQSAGAVGAAAQNFVNTLNQGAILARDVMDEADFTQAFSNAAQSLSALESKLTTSLSVDPEEIPEGVDFNRYATIVKPDGTSAEELRPRVFTHEVAGAWWDRQSKSIIDEAVNGVRNPRMRDRLRLQLETRYGAPGTAAVATTQINRAIAYGKASTDAAIESAIAGGDEKSALEALNRSVILGVYDPEKAQERATYIASQVDKRGYMIRMYKAENEGELDAVRESILLDPNRMTDTDRRALLDDLNDYSSRMNRDEQERFDNGNALLTEKYIRGTLTNDEIIAAIRNRDIDPDRGGSLAEMVRQRRLQELADARIKDPRQSKEAFSQIARSILMIRNPYLFNQNSSTVRGMAETARTAVMRQLANGVIDGETAIKAMDLIDKSEKAPAEDPLFRAAVDRLRATTQVSLGLDGTLEGNEDSKRAYSDGLRAMLIQQQTYPGTDWIKWADRNLPNYDPKGYSSRKFVRLSTTYPEVDRFITKDNGKITEKSQLDYDALIIDLATGVKSGKITPSRALEIKREAQFTDRPATIPVEDLMPDPDNVLFEIMSEPVN
jgi:hypothetical protein